MGLHLAIEALGIKHSGGATVLADLISAAVADDRFSQISIFCSPRSSRTFGFPASDKISEMECPAAERNRLYRWWWLENSLAAAVGKIGAHVVLGMCGAGLAGAATPHVTFIQQSLPFSPEAQALMSFTERVTLKAIFGAMKRSCHASSGVLVQTHTMKEVVRTAFGISSGRIEVIPPMVRELQRAEHLSAELGPMRAARPGLRLLYVGNESKYKNVKVLIDASAILRKRFPAFSAFLTWPADHPANGHDGVVCLGYLKGPALNEAYQLSDVFVMPSLQETVGLPMLEAMSAGTPVLAADRPYAREVCGDAALFFDPVDVGSLVAQLEIFIKDDSLRTGLKDRGLAISKKRRGDQPYVRMLDAAVRAAGLPRAVKHA